MADDIILGAAVGVGDTVAADDVAALAAKVQRVKAGLGADGLYTDPDGGAGAVTAGTQRVTLGSDDPAVASLGVLDDWDETNRAAVNPISGQVGIAGGSGTVSAATVRVSPATDVDAPTTVGHTRNEPFKESSAIGGELDDTAPVAATEGNVSPVRITAQRALHANLRNVAGTEVGTATDPVRVDPTGTTTQPVSAAALPLPAGAATAAGQLADGHNVTVDNATAAPVPTRGSDGTNAESLLYDLDTAGGTEWVRGVSLRVGAGGGSLAFGSAGAPIRIDPTGTNTQPVSAVSLPLPTGASTEATLADVRTAAQLLDDVVQTDDGAFTVATDKVAMAGALAVAHGSAPDAADAGDAAVPVLNRHRIPFTIGGHPALVTLENATTIAQTDAAFVTVGAGSKIVVTQIQAVTDEATTVGVGFRVGFGAVTTPTTTGVVLTHPGMVPGSGVSRGDGAGMLGVGADGEDLRLTCEVPTGGSLRILVSYYVVPS